MLAFQTCSKLFINIFFHRRRDLINHLKKKKRGWSTGFITTLEPTLISCAIRSHSQHSFLPSPSSLPQRKRTKKDLRLREQLIQPSWDIVSVEKKHIISKCIVFSLKHNATLKYIIVPLQVARSHDWRIMREDQLQIQYFDFYVSIFWFSSSSPLIPVGSFILLVLQEA